jgi:quercetin dioxygenase-like cupin family protein
MEGTTMSPRWTAGNAAEDSKNHRGWFVGQFINPDLGVRHSEDTEVKWGIHPSGEKRPEWTADDQRTTLTILIEGHFRVDTTDGTSTMERPGDYVMWGPGVDHTWEALADSVVLTVRWPSPKPSSS